MTPSAVQATSFRLPEAPMSHSSPAQRLDRRTWLSAAALASLLTAPWVGGCESSKSQTAVRIFAASSLTDLLRDLTKLVTESPWKVELQLSLSGSHTLRHQLEQGARADLFISAHLDHLTLLEERGLVSNIQAFADNRLALIVPRDNPSGLKGFSDLQKAKHLILADQNVPLGVYTRALLSHFSDPSRLRVASRENNARLVRAKVELGEADAAIVYASDAQSSNKVLHLPLPDSLNPRVRYFLALCNDSKNANSVGALLAAMKSPAARRLIAKHGFLEAEA